MIPQKLIRCSSGILRLIKRNNRSSCFWESEDIYLSIDDYKVTAWAKIDQVRGITTDGVKIGIYNLQGEKVSSSISITGKKIGLS